MQSSGQWVLDVGAKIVRWPELELPMGFQVRDDIPITLTSRERDGPSDPNRLRGFGAESMILPCIRCHSILGSVFPFNCLGELMISRLQSLIDSGSAGHHVAASIWTGFGGLEMGADQFRHAALPFLVGSS